MTELHEAVKLFINQPLDNPLTRGQIMEIARIALPILEQQERGEGARNLKHVGYLFVNSGGGVVYSLSGYGMRDFTCAGKIYGDVNFQQEPVEDGWIEWKGGSSIAWGSPVESNVRVDVITRDGTRCLGRTADSYFWGCSKIMPNLDIIAYRIIPERATNQNGDS